MELKHRELTEREIELVVQHIPFAKQIARRFCRERNGLFSVEAEELEAAALLGLCEAARRFDPARCDNFMIFSRIRIKGAMLDTLRRSGPGGRKSSLLPPTPALDDDVELRDRPVARSCHSESGRMRFSYLDWLESLGQTVQSIDESGELGIVSPGDLSPEQRTVDRDFREYLQRKLEELPERERIIISTVYYEELNFRAVQGRCEGISKSWISRLHGRAISRLRAVLEDENAAA